MNWEKMKTEKYKISTKTIEYYENKKTENIRDSIPKRIIYLINKKKN